MDCAAQVGRAKKDQGIPLRDFQVEHAVLEHAESLSRDLRLALPLVRSIMQLLVAESRAEQERQAYSTYTGEAESILVIGGRGKMGRWCADFFEDQGHRVAVYDIASRVQNDRGAIVTSEPEVALATGDLAVELKRAALAVIATPLEVVPKTIDEVVEIGFRGTLVDIASLKGHLKPSIARALHAGIAVTSIHPMFGPSTKALSGQVICICDCGNPEAANQVRSFFAETAASLVDLSLEEHDRIMSLVLGLSHLTNILFTRVLMQEASSFETLHRVGSTTFHSQMSTTATVMRDNPELYYAIQKLNPFTPRVYRSLSRELDRLTDAVTRGDRHAFVKLMVQGREWLADRP